MGAMGRAPHVEPLRQLRAREPAPARLLRARPPDARVLRRASSRNHRCVRHRRRDFPLVAPTTRPTDSISPARRARNPRRPVRSRVLGIGRAGVSPSPTSPVAHLPLPSVTRARKRLAARKKKKVDAVSGFEDVHVHRFTDDGRYLYASRATSTTWWCTASRASARRTRRRTSPAEPRARAPPSAGEAENEGARIRGSGGAASAPSVRGGEPRARVAQPATTRDRWRRPAVHAPAHCGRRPARARPRRDHPGRGVPWRPPRAAEAPPPRDRGAGASRTAADAAAELGRTRIAAGAAATAAGVGGRGRGRASSWSARRPRMARWRRGRVSARERRGRRWRARAPRLRRTRWRRAAPMLSNATTSFRVRPPWTRWRFTDASATGVRVDRRVATTTCACDARQPCPCSRRPRARAWCPCCRCGGRRFACCASPWRAPGAGGRRGATGGDFRASGFGDTVSRVRARKRESRRRGRPRRVVCGRAHAGGVGVRAGRRRAARRAGPRRASSLWSASRRAPTRVFLPRDDDVSDDDVRLNAFGTRLGGRRRAAFGRRRGTDPWRWPRARRDRRTRPARPA